MSNIQIGSIRLSRTLALCFFFAMWTTRLFAQLDIDLEKEPFRYTETEANNRVTRLSDQLKAKEIKLEQTREHGYLRSILAALEIPESSQVLVFSKTSLQIRFISRQNPRAVFFNDDTYVGWVHGSSLIELSTSDPNLGAAFYTLDMASWKPKIVRADYDCLGCHATSMTQGVPGHVVRSVLPTFDGSVQPQKESFITDHSSPFSKRWGGWYVTGRHGEMRHMGNAILRADKLETDGNDNRDDLRSEFNTRDYLAPYSDIVALMVLEHQSQMHNAMTRADFTLRQMQFDWSNKSTNPITDEERQYELKRIAAPVVQSLLFTNEAALTNEVSGRPEFAADFKSRGPTDRKGRSLRDFDLKTRLFKYPCSYLIYSPTFDTLQPTLRNEIYRQMFSVLTGKDDSKEFQHLSPAMRTDILQILVETKQDLPEEWKINRIDRR